MLSIIFSVKVNASNSVGAIALSLRLRRDNHASFRKIGHIRVNLLNAAPLLFCVSLTAKIFHFGGCRRTRGITAEALLASFEELLGPTVVKALHNALTATQLRNAVLAFKAV